MSRDDDFERRLAGMRAKLHRYCARMIGSAIDGEDVVQEVLVRAVRAHAGGVRIGNLEGWLFRVAHNACLDHLRAPARHTVVQLADDMQAVPENERQPDVAFVSFRAFLQLSVLQRCAVVLKDVLGHTIAEIAELAECSAPAAKSALQRGRKRLRETAARRESGFRGPHLDEAEHRRLLAYVDAFRAGDFDAIRDTLADEVRLDLVNRLQLSGRDQVRPYFTRYAEAGHWRYALGALDGRAAMLVYDGSLASSTPSHFVSLDWSEGAITRIRDFLFAPYAMEGADWVLIE